jgi:hypothetical protein
VQRRRDEDFMMGGFERWVYRRSTARRGAIGTGTLKTHGKFAVSLPSVYVFSHMARYYSGENQPLGTW